MSARSGGRGADLHDIELAVVSTQQSIPTAATLGFTDDDDDDDDDDANGGGGGGAGVDVLTSASTVRHPARRRARAGTDAEFHLLSV